MKNNKMMKDGSHKKWEGKRRHDGVWKQKWKQFDFQKIVKKKQKEREMKLKKRILRFIVSPKWLCWNTVFFSSFVSFTFRGMNGVEEETELNATAYK